ncbi:hypothetical protein BFJ63_vAg11566 [Fusarium oxysporum f. sp. narcissi]|uniref:Uncharacterized protein n=1 Tax=Fusarium oxysporum f. sp. narcissi TaxID=451672 RepID=A0A4V1RZM2_FUSOX|nr:hypothetical protein BFJ63_vAg11566 [Fusarium oxysporum f. sp. narcissi]
MSGLRIPKRTHESQQSSRPRKKPEKEAKTPVSDLALRIARNCLDERPPITIDKINEVMRPSPAVDFANRRPEIEEGAMKLYNASNEKEDYDNFDPEKNTPVVKEFKALWKVCLRLWEISPTVLISPMCGLRYFPATPKRGGRANQAVFSPEFSKLFAELIPHPCWNFEHERFLLALQYVVKCRVDNRSPWPHKDAKERECPAIEALFNMFDESGYGEMSLHEMHKSARESVVGDRVSGFSDFLYFIGQKVKKDAVEQEQIYHGIPGLPITIGDMKTLTNAVTNFNWPDESWRCSPGEIYEAFRAERTRTTGRNELPATGDQLKEYLGRSLKDVFRDIEIYRQGADPEISSPVYEACLADVSVRDAANTAAQASAGADIDEEMHLPLNVDEELHLPQDVQQIPPEQRPVRPERRYKALVGGEESEDEQADLARNLRDYRVARLPPDSQRRRREYRSSFGDGRFPGIHGESPYEKGGFSSRQVRPTTRQPATAGRSGFMLSQLPIPSDIRLEKPVKVFERGQQRLESVVHDTRVSPSQEVKRLQQRVESPNLRQLEGGTRDTGAVQTGNADLVNKVHDLESKLTKAARGKQSVSEKVESHELEIKRLSKELAEKDKVHKRDSQRLSKKLSENDKKIESAMERIRDLEAELTLLKAIGPGAVMSGGQGTQVDAEEDAYETDNAANTEIHQMDGDPSIVARSPTVPLLGLCLLRYQRFTPRRDSSM